MTTQHIIQTLVELCFISLLILGYLYEGKVINFEQNIKRIVVGNYRRWKRSRIHKQKMTEHKVNRR